MIIFCLNACTHARKQTKNSWIHFKTAFATYFIFVIILVSLNFLTIWRRRDGTENVKFIFFRNELWVRVLLSEYTNDTSLSCRKCQLSSYKIVWLFLDKYHVESSNGVYTQDITSLAVQIENVGIFLEETDYVYQHFSTCTVHSYYSMNSSLLLYYCWLFALIWKMRNPSVIHSYLPF